MGREVHQRRNELRLFSLVALAIIAAALALLVLLLVPGAVGGAIVGDQPPSTGDWYVQNDTTVTGETVTIDGDLIVEATLTLQGSVLRLDPPGPGAIGINVTASGYLEVLNSTIESATGENYTFLVRGEMALDRVTVRHTYWGIQVRTGDPVRISDVLITDILGTALLLEDADDTAVEDLRVHDDDYLLRGNKTVVTGTTDGFVEYSDHLPGLIVVSGGNPRIDGVDISVNGTLEYYVQFDQNTADGGLDIDLEWPVFDVDTREPIAITDVWFRESRLQLKCRVTQGQVVAETVDVNLIFGTSTFVLRNYRDARVQGLELTAVWAPPIILNVTSAGSGVEITQGSEDRGNLGVHAYVDGVFTTAGPHRFKLTIEDVYLFEDAFLLHRLTPGYSGASPPTFEQDLLVDNVTLELSKAPAFLVLEPAFPSMKTFDLDIRFSNSTFKTLQGPAVEFDYRTGPKASTSRSIEVRERTFFENCTFTDIWSGNHGIIKVSTRIHGNDPFRSTLWVSDSRFLKNRGTLLNINGTGSHTRERLVVMNSTFENNTCSDDQRLMLTYRTEVDIISNRFINNRASNGILLMDVGAWSNDFQTFRYPCSFNITDNSFDGNLAHQDHAPPKAFIDVVWGGVLNISGNAIARTGSDFLNLSDFSNYSRDSVFYFAGNTVTENDHRVLYFTHNGRNHTYLDVVISNNTVQDNEGALVGYLPDPGEFQYNDYGATFHLLDNDVRGAGSTVFAAYGNITVSGNTFTDCAGWVLRLEHLRMHRPYLTENTFTRCGDAILIKAKIEAPLPVLLWMDNNVIDSSGTAIEFYYMEVTLRNTIVTGSPYRAVVADLSYVDAYDCDFKREDCEVVVTGYIRMWYWVEGWVHWASKDGVATDNPVDAANVTFVDQAGEPSLTVFADGEGHLPPFEVMAWHIESASSVEKNPYTIVVSLSSFRTTVDMTVNRSHRGVDALELLLWDPEDPFVSIDSPEDMSALNSPKIEIIGFATDVGSGVHTLTVVLNGGAPYLVVPGTDGGYLLELNYVTEGMVVVVATATDAGGNSMVASITMEVDRTAPRLVVTYPSGELFTNETSVHIRGEVETGVELMVNMLEVPTETGVFDIPLPLNEGPNYFGLAATDRAGNTASVVIWVTRDTFEPELTLYGPADGQTVNHTDVTVWGLVQEADAVTITLHRRFTDIVDRPINPDAEGRFEVLAELEEGENEIVVTARDRSGNSVTVRRTVTLDTTPPSLELLSPEAGTLLNVRQVTVVFSVSDDVDQVYVNGKRVLGTGELDTVVMLGEGENPITLWAVDALMNRVSLEVIVHVDTVAPTLDLTQPNASTIKTNDPAIEVRGVARDGDLNGITVTVDGAAATVTTDGKFYHLLTLEEDGTHQVEVVARDRAGNIARTSFTVDLRTEAPLMSLLFTPMDDRVDPGTVLHIQGAATHIPLTVTIVHDAAGDRREYTFLMINASFEHYLNLVNGVNTVTIRSVDGYDNWNVTTPHVVDVRERDVQETSDPSTLYLIAAVVVAVALIVVAYILVRRSP